MTQLFYALIFALSVLTITLLIRGKKTVSYRVHVFSRDVPVVIAIYGAAAALLLPYLSAGVAWFLGAVLAHWFGTRAYVGELPIHRGMIGVITSRAIGVVSLGLLVAIDLWIAISSPYLAFTIGVLFGFVFWPPARTK